MITHGEVVVGVLALQGAFSEHERMLRDLRRVGDCTVQALQVRTPDDLAACDALIIPGGESTTIALLMRSSALEGPLQAFLKVKPVWGTCAGAILLSNAVVGAKRGGQELLRAMDVTIERNGFGSQLDSFEAPLQVGQGPNDGGRIFHGVFIRAPVVLAAEAKNGSPPVEIISRLPVELLPTLTNPTTNVTVAAGTALLSDSGHAVSPESLPVPRADMPEGTGSAILEDDPRRIVALRQGRHMLTTFHPELSGDAWFHEYFVRACVLGNPL